MRKMLTGILTGTVTALSMACASAPAPDADAYRVNNVILTKVVTGDYTDDRHKFARMPPDNLVWAGKVDDAVTRHTGAIPQIRCEAEVDREKFTASRSVPNAVALDGGSYELEPGERDFRGAKL